MKNSFFFKRVVALTLLSIAIFALLTGTLFYYTSKNIMVEQAISQLHPAAKYISEMLYLHRQQNLSDDNYFITKINASVIVQARIHIFDSNGVLEFFPNDEALLTFAEDGEKDVEFQSAILPELNTAHLRLLMKHRSALRKRLSVVLEGNEIAESIGNYIVVGVPVYDQETGEITDAVFMSKTAEEVLQVRNSLYNTLFISMGMVAVLLIFMIPIITRQISSPLYQMRDVAIKMAKGDRVVRADSSLSGEMGQLADSLNYLRSALSRSITELQIEKNRLLSILDGLGEGIVAVDNNLEITHINPAIESLFGKFDPGFSPQKYIKDESFWEQVENVVLTGQETISHMQKGALVLRNNTSPLQADDGSIVGAVSLLRDVTESERLEQTRKDYVANVSHELRTPVSSLRSMAETLSDGMVPDEKDRLRYYAYMLSEADRLSSLIDDLLELSRLQSGTIAMKKQWVNTEELLWDVAERFKIMFEAESKKFRLENIEGIPKCYSNEDRIEQMLVILIDNASKYTDVNGEIILGASWDDEKVTFSVCDTGRGIAQEDLLHIFDRFYKVDKAHTGDGTGLGLSIASELLALLGEKIWVESEIGEGACFFFTASILQDEIQELNE